MPARPVVTLYSRPGCSLCLEALAELRKLARELRFDVDVIDIERDDALHRRYMFEIPVVLVDGVEVARAPLRGHMLEDAVRDALSW